MHISEGVLDARFIVGGYAVAAGLTALALVKVKQQDIPRISVMGAAFFVSSLIHFKVGITSVHLTLIGLTGIVLGPTSTLALLAGLFFQAVMFQHGGLSTLGVNTAIFAGPALIVALVFSWLAPRYVRKPTLLSVFCGLLTALAILLAAALVFVLLLITGEALRGVAFVFSAAHGVLGLVEGIITFLVVRQILRIKPGMLRPMQDGAGE